MERHYQELEEDFAQNMKGVIAKKNAITESESEKEKKKEREREREREQMI